jgi:hypothetical protein
MLLSNIASQHILHPVKPPYLSIDNTHNWYIRILAAGKEISIFLLCDGAMKRIQQDGFQRC